MREGQALARCLLSIGAMANEHSGILDANALFGDLPWIAVRPASSVPPRASGPMAPAHAYVFTVEATAPSRRRRDETTARSRPRVDPVRAQLISVILCGLVALVAALIACFFYVTAPQHAPASHVLRAGPAMTGSR
jgi:hypothetical protein